MIILSLIWGKIGRRCRIAEIFTFNLTKLNIQFEGRKYLELVYRPFEKIMNLKDLDVSNFPKVDCLITHLFISKRKL